MADICDNAQVIIDQELERNLRSASFTRIEPGQPGECEYCGYQSPRLVGGACARCRDSRRMS